MATDKEKLDIERQKIELEKMRLELERQKLEFEKQKQEEEKEKEVSENEEKDIDELTTQINLKNQNKQYEPNKLGIGLAILMIIAVFLPWVEASSSASAMGYSAEYSTGQISGINFGDGFIAILLSVAGGFLMYKRNEFAILMGGINILIGVAHLAGWTGFNLGTSTSYESTLGDASITASIIPQFGLYLFTLVSALYSIVSFSNFKKSTGNEEVIAISKVESNIKTTRKYNETVALLHQLVVYEQKRFFWDKSNKEEIQGLLSKLCKTKEDGKNLLDVYKKLFGTDLIHDLGKPYSSYSNISESVRPFIELGIVQEKYPDKIID